MDRVSHGVDVPIIGLDDIIEDFGTSRLFGDYRRDAHLHGFERRDAERFGNRRHDVDIAGLEHLIDLLAFLEAGEMETIGDAALGGKSDHLIHHVARTGHNKADVMVIFKNLGGSLDKIFRAFLHCDAAEECDDFLFRFLHFDIKQFSAQGHNGIVNRRHFGRIYAITFYDSLTRQIADSNYMIGIYHAVAFDIEHRRIDIAARTVVVCSVDMDHQRLAGHLLGMYACRICQPVVTVNDVTVDRAGNDTGCYRIIVDLFKKVVGIAARELDTSEIIGAHVIEVGIYMVAQTEIQIRIHHLADARLDIITGYIAPRNRHL